MKTNNKVVVKQNVFEGTIAGRKFLFAADHETLDPVAEIPNDKTANEIALQHSADLVARAKANHKAVQALVREWVRAKKAAKALTPEAIAVREAKNAEKAHKRAQQKAELAKAKADKAKAKNDAKLAKQAKKSK